MISDEEIGAVVGAALHDLYPVPSAAAASRPTPERRRRPRHGPALAAAFATIVLVAAAVIIPAYVLRGHRTAASTPTPAAPTSGTTASSRAPSVPSAAPAWTAACIPPVGTRAVDYLGALLGDAENRARSHDVTLVVVGLDGTCLPVLAKAFRNPLWVAISGDLVVEARYRGWSGPPR